MRVTSVQLAIRDETKAATVERMFALLDQAAGSDLILLPELWPTGYFSFGRYAAEAETLDGPLVTELRAKAKRLKVHLFAGSFVERSGSDLFNTSLLISPHGEILGSYRKIHLFGFQSEERRLLKAGLRPTVIQTPFGKAGLSTCYDLRFPELYRAMIEQGADIFLVAAAWPRQRLDAWKLFCQARAAENLSFLFSSNCAGTNQGTAFGAHSLMVDPFGSIVAEAGEGEQLLSAECDPHAVASARSSFSVLQDRSPLFK